MRTLTMKFGGASVGSAETLNQVVNIILQEHQRWDGLILVVSALSGVTDDLIKATQFARIDTPSKYHLIVADLRSRHMKLIEQLQLEEDERRALYADIDQLLFEMLNNCRDLTERPQDIEPETIDRIVGMGEQLSAQIVSTLLRHHDLRGAAIDATEIIITAESHGRIDLGKTRTRVREHLLPMLNHRIIPVIPGFIAGTSSGKPTTLGRGGSDYTASIISQCVQTDEMWMWTNVDGIMTTNPHLISTARTVPHLTYDEGAELAYFGAKILHSRMIGPLQEQGIPLCVKNIFDPTHPYTQVSNAASCPTPQIKAVTCISGIGLSTGQSGSLANIINEINTILLKTINNTADVTVTSQSSSRSFISFVVPTSAGTNVDSLIQNALNDHLRQHLRHQDWQVQPVTFITAVGANLDKAPRLIGQIFAAMENIPILALSQGPSHCSLSIVVSPQDAPEALNRIHQLVTDCRS